MPKTPITTAWSATSRAIAPLSKHAHVSLNPGRQKHAPVSASSFPNRRKNSSLTSPFRNANGRLKKSERAFSGPPAPPAPANTSGNFVGVPRECNLAAKKNSQGHNRYWRGYKLHIDVADGQIPLACLLTSASLHDSQGVIPLATLSATVRMCRLRTRTYQDSLRGYDKRRTLPCKVPPSRIEFITGQEHRYKRRGMSERVNARLKDEFGGRTLRVRGASKAIAHLMFGSLALTAHQLLRLRRLETIRRRVTGATCKMQKRKRRFKIESATNVWREGLLRCRTIAAAKSHGAHRARFHRHPSAPSPSR